MKEIYTARPVKGVNDANIKAGVIGKIGIDDDFSKMEKILCAVCIAQLKTGLGLLIHINPYFDRVWNELHGYYYVPPSTSRLSVTDAKDYSLLHVKTTFPEHRGSIVIIGEHTELIAGHTASTKGI